MGSPNTPSHPHSERRRSARPPSGRRRSASPSARSGSYNARHRSTVIENDTWCRCCIRTAADSLMRPPESFRSTRIEDRSLRHGRVGCSRLPKCKMRSRHPSTCHCSCPSQVGPGKKCLECGTQGDACEPVAAPLIALARHVQETYRAAYGESVFSVASTPSPALHRARLTQATGNGGV